MKHLTWLKDKGARRACVAHHACQHDYTQFERLYRLECADKHGALAPLTVREALGVAAVRADDATVCPIDYLDLAYPDLQPLRRCAAACGAAYHAQCITAWHAQLAKEGKALSCPVCRCAWMDALAVGARERAGVTYTTTLVPFSETKYFQNKMLRVREGGGQYVRRSGGRDARRSSRAAAAQMYRRARWA